MKQNRFENRIAIVVALLAGVGIGSLVQSWRMADAAFEFGLTWDAGRSKWQMRR